MCKVTCDRSRLQNDARNNRYAESLEPEVRAIAWLGLYLGKVGHVPEGAQSLSLRSLERQGGAFSSPNFFRTFTGAQSALTSVATASNEMQVLSAIVATEPLGHPVRLTTSIRG